MTPTDGDLLLKAVLATPADDTVRLAYADWLDEHSCSDRAEFIRVQVALAGTLSGPDFCRLRDRERELLQGGREWDTAFWSPHLDPWIQGLPGKVPCLHKTEPAVTVGVGDTAIGPPKKYTFRRGFVECVSDCTAADWLQFGDAITAAHPVTKVVLTTRPDEFEEKTVYPLAAGLVTLHVAGRNVTIIDYEDPRSRFTAALAERWKGVVFELPPLVTGPMSGGGAWSVPALG